MSAAAGFERMAARSDQAEALAQAIALLRAERISEAEPALLALLRRWPYEPNALHYLGVLRHTQGRVSEALELIQHSLALAGSNIGAWNNLGNVLLAAGRVDQATQAYERGVAAGPARPEAADALNNLCTVYRKQGHWVQAEDAARRALALREDFGDAWYNLSLALMAQGQVHDGLLANSRAIALWPRHVQARDQVIRALVLLGERDQAAALYREWQAEEPDNPVVQHQLAACLGQAPPPRASDAYVQQVFDQFAGSFDAKLEKLHYRAPELVAQALAAVAAKAAVAGPPAAAFDIVDAGCGTGLCGPLLKPWARTLAGCDLSEGMLRRAHARGCYAPLHQAELVHYLNTQPGAFDVVASADTLCYFGPLDSPSAAAQRSLRPGGWLIFTVEALGREQHDVGHALQASGRYAHSAAHVRAALQLAGLRLLAITPETLRHEAGQPVAGWLVTAGKP